MKNLELKIEDLCPNGYIQILEDYWNFDSVSLEFVSKPTQIRKKYKISQPKLTDIVRSYSKLTFYLYCQNCNSYELKEVRSQTKLNEKIKDHQKYPNSYKCDNCKNIEFNEKNKEQDDRRNELLSRLDKAVDEKRWEHLNPFQYELLHECLTKSFSELKRHYWLVLGENRYGKLFHELKVLAKMDLLMIKIDSSKNWVTDFECYGRLKENFIYNPVKTETIRYQQDFESIETNQLRLTLITDPDRHHPDSPKYAGSVKFKQRIVIEPDVEYSFAQWERSGDNLYFVLTPIDEIYPTPIQTPISRLPTSLQDGIRDFLENIKPL